MKLDWKQRDSFTRAWIAEKDGAEIAEIVECTDDTFSLFIHGEWHSKHESFAFAAELAEQLI